ncbi:MAG TPA: Fe-Mn family superoxide dismutase [Patescibacteria group bacterium]|nr:Fe-Mn family superoxide dismutase [Patescibacteria group bacterium]
MKQETYRKFELPRLEYAYNSLEPFIDEATMKLHHDKHHQTYTDKFNEALEKYPELFRKKPEEIISELDKIPEDIRVAVKNHGGGYINHNFFWKILKKNTETKGKIKFAIDKKFGSVENFRKEFSAAALGVFGSGWAWLVLNENKELEIIKTPNQESPLTLGKIPLLTIDVWEHAYYLKYQNRRAEYVENFFNVINWQTVEKNFAEAMKMKLKRQKNWNELAEKIDVELTMNALRKNGINSYFVENKRKAKEKLEELIPMGAEVMNMSSVTLDESKIAEEITKSGRYEPVKKKLESMDRKTQGREMQRIGAAPQYAVGSVHAVTEDGKVIIASNTGSQLPAYAYGADRVIFIVGTQKIVKNLDEAMKRIYDYILPLESERLKKVYGVASFVSKVLLINKEINPERINVIFVNEVLGF